MPKSSIYPATGFLALTEVTKGGGPRSYLQAAVAIAKGDFIHDDTAGYATNATTSFTVAAIGVATETVSNSGGSLGDTKILVIPWQFDVQYIVAVEENALITQTAVGTLVDLQSVNTIDINDTTIATGPGFWIDEIDVSVAAIAANTFGFAIGHFTQTD